MDSLGVLDMGSERHTAHPHGLDIQWILQIAQNCLVTILRYYHMKEEYLMIFRICSHLKKNFWGEFLGVHGNAEDYNN